MFYWSHGEQNTKLHSLFQTMPQLYKSLLIRAIRDQCRRVVTFFWSNTKCHRETVQMGKPKMKLIQEMETWWNCTFFHASKIIRRTWNGANLTSLNTNIMLLDNGQFEVISQCLHALSSFNHTSEQVIQWNFGEKTKQSFLISQYQEHLCYMKDFFSKAEIVKDLKLACLRHMHTIKQQI